MSGCVTDGPGSTSSLELALDIDPNKIPRASFSEDVDTWPSVTYPDIVNYLVFSPNPLYTLEQMKAYKSLEAHNQFTSGWVHDVRVCYPRGDIAAITGRVLHSQSINKTMTKPWILAQKDGKIIRANCDCKAGLGRSCCHIAAVLFRVQAAILLREKRTVTQEKAYWLLPTGIKKVEYSAAKNINFTSAKSKKKLLDTAMDMGSRPGQSVPVRQKPSGIPTPSKEETEEFFTKLNATLSTKKPGILTITSPFNDQFVRDHGVDCASEPKPLSELLPTDCCNISNLEDLIHLCSSVNVSLTQEQANKIEQQTRDRSKLWHTYRTGRITASRMKTVCRTSLEKPSMSLVTSICYPQTVLFQTQATKWGCDHEKTAREQYERSMRGGHDDFRVEDVGLIINPEYPHMGATPDGIVSCACCGEGAVEIKCPFCIRDKSAYGHSCLQVEGNSDTCIYRLDKTHAYYYQVQTQIFVSKRDFCDFVIWTGKDFHYERILPNVDFWEDISRKSDMFFKKVILPELMGKYFSRHSKLSMKAKHSVTSTCSCITHTVTNSVTSIAGCSTGTLTTSVVAQEQNVTNVQGKTATSMDDKWCLCQEAEYGRMVACDNENCPFQWFHYECVGVQRQPRGKWLCPQCR